MSQTWPGVHGSLPHNERRSIVEQIKYTVRILSGGAATGSLIVPPESSWSCTDWRSIRWRLHKGSVKIGIVAYDPSMRANMHPNVV